MDERIEKTLQDFGLTTNQGKIYITLLKQGELAVSTLAKITSIHRSTTYQELNVLIQKGLVSYVIRNAKRYYNAATPNKLLEIIEVNQKKINSILPSLLSLRSLPCSPVFKIEVYEGKEGVKTFYQHVLNNNAKEVLAFGVTGFAFDILQHSWPLFRQIKKWDLTYHQSPLGLRLVA